MHMHMDAGHDGGGCLRVVPLHIHLCAGPGCGLPIHGSAVGHCGAHVGVPTVRGVRYSFTTGGLVVHGLYGRVDDDAQTDDSQCYEECCESWPAPYLFLVWGVVGWAVVVEVVFVLVGDHRTSFSEVLVTVLPCILAHIVVVITKNPAPPTRVSG